MAALPRFHQRVVASPLWRPWWTEDEHFDLAYHVRRTTVAPPGDERRLFALVAELMESHVSRFRPLWELWVLDGIAAGRFAVVLKIHHAMLDGVAAAADLVALFDHPASASDVVPPATGGTGLIQGLLRPFAATGGAMRRVAHPAGLVRDAGTAFGGAAALVGSLLRPAPRSPMNVRIGPNRSFEVARASVEDFKDIKSRFGGTVNDVVLAVTAGGLRRWLGERGVDPVALDLVALVPVSLRAPAERPTEGNHVAGVLVRLPVHEPDPTRRLELARASMRASMSSSQIAATTLLLDLPSVLPDPMVRAVAGVQRSQRFLNLSLTNVRGPAEPLRFCGHGSWSCSPSLPCPPTAP